MTNYKLGEWNIWNGGECPVHPETLVQVQRRDETRKEVENEDKEDHQPGRIWRWEHFNDRDIIAFRVIKEHREPRELWMVDMATRWEECSIRTPGAVKFREVLE